MFDFRYHALSLVAVFLALALGLVIGVAIGDKGLVSSAERDIRASLRGDVRDALRRVDELNGRLADHRRFEREAYPVLVGGRLEAKRRIGLVALDDVSDGVVSSVRDALGQTGARLVSVTVVREPPSVAALAERSVDTRYEELNGRPDLLKPFGRRIGWQLVEGGRLIRQVRSALFSASSGSLGQLDGIVLVRSSSVDDLEGDDRRVAKAVEEGLVAGLVESGVSTVGVERSNTEDSQIEWFKDRGLSTVDNVDQVAGKAALVFALAGAEGSFGVGPGVDALLPRAVDSVDISK